jgi:DNA-binding CsgD family transcriptional regulator
MSVAEARSLIRISTKDVEMMSALGVAGIGTSLRFRKAVLESFDAMIREGVDVRPRAKAWARHREETRVKIGELWKAGMGTEQIARAFGLSVSTIQRIRSELLLAPRHASGRPAGPRIHKVPDDDRKKIAALSAEGISREDVARRFHISRDSVRRVRREQEVEA